MKLREWFLKTEPSFDIGIFITLVISIIGFWHKGKKDKEESKKQKERYEKESEERFKAIEKQISMQKEVEKEMIVRKELLSIYRLIEEKIIDCEEYIRDTIWDFERIYLLNYNEDFICCELFPKAREYNNKCIELERLISQYIYYDEFEQEICKKYLENNGNRIKTNYNLDKLLNDLYMKGEYGWHGDCAKYIKMAYYRTLKSKVVFDELKIYNTNCLSKKNESEMEYLKKEIIERLNNYGIKEP